MGPLGLAAVGGYSANPLEIPFEVIRRGVHVAHREPGSNAQYEESAAGPGAPFPQN